ncbi:MAG: hypothetical protein ACJAYN_002061 [Bermanella sp.]|jgi:hypothetical protein
MTPNLEQLLLVCGICVSVVALIFWLLVKLPVEQNCIDDD